MSRQGVSINILGYGFVGEAMGFLCEKNKLEFNVFDLKQKNGNFNYFNNLKDIVEFSEKNNPLNYYIIAVPTPSDSEGKCDTSIVRSVLEDLSYLIQKETCVIIKSTLVPGTCDELNNLFPKLNVVLCPEFLKQKTHKNDIYNAEFVLIGLPPDFHFAKYQNLLKVLRMFYSHNRMIDIIARSYKECELFKYTLNTYFGVKITFFNEIYDLCETMNVDYQKLKELFKLDSRVGDYGITVPGDHGSQGYSGHCIVKEVAGMIKLQEQLGLSNELMSCVDKRNTCFKNKDK